MGQCVSHYFNWHPLIECAESVTVFFFSFRVLKEQQNRTLVEATQPGKRENYLNMRQGEMVQPVRSKLPVTLPQELVIRALLAFHYRCNLHKLVKGLDKQGAKTSSLESTLVFVTQSMNVWYNMLISTIIHFKRHDHAYCFSFTARSV